MLTYTRFFSITPLFHWLVLTKWCFQVIVKIVSNRQTQKTIYIIVAYIIYLDWNIPFLYLHYKCLFKPYFVYTPTPPGQWPLEWYRSPWLIPHVIPILTCNIQYIYRGQYHGKLIVQATDIAWNFDNTSSLTAIPLS